MTDREKLVELIVEAENNLIREKPYTEDQLRIKRTVDYLISHGVTVKEPQKPLTVEECREKVCGIVWFEEANAGLLYDPLRSCFIGRYYAEFEQHGTPELFESLIENYGKTWRCWAEKPTEEERKAAEWLD